jgi:translation initiation factor 4E
METIATSSTTQALFPVPNEQLPQLSTSPSRLQISNKQTEQEKKESKEPMTIPKDYATKHPLHNSWTLWFDHNQEKNNAANWKASLKKIYTFSTVCESISFLFCVFLLRN